MKGIIFLTVSALLYTVVTTFIFFRKDKINKVENIIYKRLLMTTILSMISELSIVFTTDIEIVSTIIQKGFLVVLILWLAVFMTYTFVITTFDEKVSEEKNIEKYKFLYYIFIFINIMICILIFILPLQFNSVGDAKYTSGPAVNVVFVTLGIYVSIMGVLVLIHIKNINKKGYIPIISLIILLTIVGIIQKLHPEMLLSNAVFGFIIYLMYHTIENPDMKMLREIQKSKEFAEQANTEKAMFLYNTSQELKSPVNAISQRCEELLQEQDINEIINGIKDIKFAAKRLSSTISGTLDMNKIQATNIEIKVSRYQAKMLLQEMISISKLNMKEKTLDFRVNLDDNIPEYLMGDSIRLKQIITTIMNNAIKHTESGFIEFSVSSVIKHDICRLIITIEDSGSGIESKKLETLFYNKDDEEVLDEEKLNNVGDTRERLSVIKILTNLIGGTVIVNSELGKGSKFTVVLDQQIAETKKTSTMKAIEKLSSNKRILVVDDEEESLKQITKVLNKYDINVDTVEWGQECLEKIRNKQKYDLILLDEDMPRLNGIKTFEKLKIEDNFNIPVVIMINNNHIDYKDRYLYNGFSGCIVKPIKKTDIDKILKKFVNEDE